MPQEDHVGQAAAWRDLLRLDSDFTFETDVNGVILALEPGLVLGWKAEALVGQSAGERLLDSSSSIDPFCAAAPIRRRQIYLKTADHGLASVMITAAPGLDDAGNTVIRGVGHDITRQETRTADHLAERRRIDVFLRSLEAMRREAAPAARVQTMIDTLLGALKAEGLVLAELLGKNQSPAPRHRAGSNEDHLPAALAVLDPDGLDVRQGLGPDGRPVLTCPVVTRFGERIALAAWGAVDAPSWEDGNLDLVRMICATLGAVLEHESIQREMARQIRNDPLTGLLNRRTFIAETLRRIDRLDREDLNGTFLLIELDDFNPLDRLGPEAGDAALCIMARILRDAVRPMDLVARLGGGHFAAWMDGADELTGAERAEMLRLQTPRELAQLAAAPGLSLTISIGIACRRPGQGEELESVMRRASLALEGARHGGWRVSRDDPF